MRAGHRSGVGPVPGPVASTSPCEAKRSCYRGVLTSSDHGYVIMGTGSRPGVDHGVRVNLATYPLGRVLKHPGP